MESESEKLLDAIRNRDPVGGLTHGFYRYPARFSPILARSVIQHFTKPGDTVLDPFVGGGTSLVEARALARNAIGVDISSLAVFISRVKTTPLSRRDLEVLQAWADNLPEKLNLRNRSIPASQWKALGYQRNMSDRQTWPIRKTLELAIHWAERLPRARQQHFARCVFLKTAQWALDCRKEIPTAPQFRECLLDNFYGMLAGAHGFAQMVREAEQSHGLRGRLSTHCIHRSAVGLEVDPRLAQKAPPTLVLTSPPYPGVHVLYHRWQVRGRKESPAPFWLANSVDGHGCAYYTFGDRQSQLTTYYQGMLQAFRSLARLVRPTTLVVQVLAFSDPSWQLPEYLTVMAASGFEEAPVEGLTESPDGRVWRVVPNRKWYASQRGVIHASQEVVLFHRLKRS